MSVKSRARKIEAARMRNAADGVRSTWPVQRWLREYADLLDSPDEAARRWDSFPSDEDVEAAALTLHFADEGAMPARYYREQAHAALLAVKAREDGVSS